jgi:hypothetical protein
VGVARRTGPTQQAAAQHVRADGEPDFDEDREFHWILPDRAHPASGADQAARNRHRVWSSGGLDLRVSTDVAPSAPTLLDVLAGWRFAEQRPEMRRSSHLPVPLTQRYRPRAGMFGAHQRRQALRAIIAALAAATIACRAAPAPALESVEPHTVFDHETVELTIRGTFQVPVTVNLDDPNASTLQPYEVELSSPGQAAMSIAGAFRDSRTLSALLPAGLPPGAYRVRVVDPWGRDAALDDALIVTSRPDIVAICSAIGSGCASASECCSNACAATCQLGGGGCGAMDAPCTADYNCCSGTCSLGSCIGSGTPCLTAGEPAGSDLQCCSRLRDTDGRCRAHPVCRPRGEPCSSGAQCCSLYCENGYCKGLLWCLATFEPCENNSDCCSGECDPDSFGFRVCIPIGGCRTSGRLLTTEGALNEFGEICASSAECCSALCEPDSSGALRCKKRGDPRSGASNPVCLPEGELCNTGSTCCSGAKCIAPVAPPDAGYVLPTRCLIPSGTLCRSDGASCVEPSQCCIAICVLHPDQTYRCGPPGVDAGTCIPAGGGCTRDADCCSGTLCAPEGDGRLSCRVIQ